MPSGFKALAKLVPIHQDMKDAHISIVLSVRDFGTILNYLS